MSRIYVGTCSWSDHTDFYPSDLPANQQIMFYAEHFPIVEIDSTFYRLMPTRNFSLWAERTPPGFIFDVKPYRQLTWHDRENPPDRAVFDQFGQSIQPLRDAGKLGAVNFQFPPWFVFRQENVDYIEQCRERMYADRLSVEFRHRSWLTSENLSRLLDALRRMQVALTVVDEPQIGSGSVPTVLAVTRPDLSIVRFHGRNEKTWYAKVERTADRFDYLYSEDELRSWLPNVEQLKREAEEIHLLFNNNRANYAVRNAQQVSLMLGLALSGTEVT